jgi:hypothetical protein
MSFQSIPTYALSYVLRVHCVQVHLSRQRIPHDRCNNIADDNNVIVHCRVGYEFYYDRTVKKKKTPKWIWMILLWYPRGDIADHNNRYGWQVDCMQCPVLTLNRVSAMTRNRHDTHSSAVFLPRQEAYYIYT